MDKGVGEGERKRERERDEHKRLIHNSAFLLLLIILTVPLISAGFFSDFWGKITGKATQEVSLNITVGAILITHVFNESMTYNVTGGLNAGPSPSSVIINFTAYHGAGSANIDNSTATINLTRTGETTRTNSSCLNITGLSSDYMNFTCNITMWWWDSTGTWDITAFIKDTTGNSVTNSSRDMQVGSTTGFERGPATLTWSSISAGATNSTSTNDPLVLNNTGNKNISANTIRINATNLRGETTSSLALWSGNFSMSWNTSGDVSPNVECAGSQMNVTSGNYANITLANLTRGNYSINDGSTGQEQLYVCLRTAGSELTTQSYSTANETEGAWTIQII